MNPSELNALHILHVFSAVGMIAVVFYACAADPGTKKKAMTWSGIFSLVAILAGIRMWQGLYGFSGIWPVVKIVCWLAISAFAGLAYRRRQKTPLWIGLTLAASLIALVMVYVRPF